MSVNCDCNKNICKAIITIVTSHAKTFLTVCRFETVAVRKPFISRSNGMGCRSNGLSYPFKNN